MVAWSLHCVVFLLIVYEGDSRVAILQSEALYSVVDVLMDEDKFAHGSAAKVLKEFANYSV